MKATELRIGNWVKLKCSDPIENYQVTQILERGINCGSVGMLFYMVEPIPLTDEWLVRFGFVSGPYHDTYQKGFLILNCDKTRGKLELWLDNITGKVLYIKHVHTLQNLYHALTGEELELKL